MRLLSVDAELAAVRRLLRARTDEEVVAIVLDAVRDLGGTVERPSEHTNGQLPIDVTFGLGEPLVPAGDADTLDRLRTVLTPLLADAHVALDRTRRESHLADSASTDPLTGLANRRVTMRALSRLGPGDTVVMVDLDHFKAVNDNHGHDAGDAVLRTFAHTLRRAVRWTDTAGRLGGEEFAVLMPRTELSGAVTMLERLRATWLERRPHPVTFSAGVSAVGPDGPRSTLSRADAALYVAKRNGRDRVEVAI